MNYIEWCELVLQKIYDAQQRDMNARMIGIHIQHMPRILLDIDIQLGHNSPSEAILHALYDLENIGLLQDKSLWKVTDEGRQYLHNKIPTWASMCDRILEPDQQQLLDFINRHSPSPGAEFADVQVVPNEKLVTVFREERHERDYRLRITLGDLSRQHFVSKKNVPGPQKVRATFAGLVWQEKQHEVAEWKASQQKASNVTIHVDQRYQNVQYQWNVAGNINLTTMPELGNLIDKLEQLKAEVSRARDTGALTKKSAATVEYQITQAMNESEEPQPDKDSLLEHINGAKMIVETAGTAHSLVTGLIEAAEQVQQVLKEPL